MYGKLRVVGKRESVHGDITERRIEVGDVEGHGGTQRVVTLLQLSSWPLRELPHPTAILSLVELLSKAQRSSPSRHTVVMCRYIHTLSVSLSLCLSVSLSPLSLSPSHPVMEWAGLGPSSASTLSWRDSRQRVWSTSSRLSSLLAYRELDSSLMLYDCDI